jgi:hypothetical protein
VVIKTRWGKDAKGIQFEGATPGIKFALGENVKRFGNPPTTFGVTAPGTAKRATAYVYSGVGAGALFVAMSNEFDVSTPGEKVALLVGACQQLLSPYIICVQCDQGGFSTLINNGSANNVGRQCTTAIFPYRVPPAVMPTNDGAPTGHEFLAWVEGIPGLQAAGSVADNDPQFPPVLVQLGSATTTALKVADAVNNTPVLAVLSAAAVTAGARVP